MDKLSDFQLRILTLVNNSKPRQVQFYALDLNTDRFGLHHGPSSDIGVGRNPEFKMIMNRRQVNEIDELGYFGLIQVADRQIPFSGGAKRLVFLNKTELGRQKLLTLELENKLKLTSVV